MPFGEYDDESPAYARPSAIDMYGNDDEDSDDADSVWTFVTIESNLPYSFGVEIEMVAKPRALHRDPRFHSGRKWNRARRRP